MRRRGASVSRIVGVASISFFVPSAITAQLAMRGHSMLHEYVAHSPSIEASALRGWSLSSAPVREFMPAELAQALEARLAQDVERLERAGVRGTECLGTVDPEEVAMLRAMPVERRPQFINAELIHNPLMFGVDSLYARIQDWSGSLGPGDERVYQSRTVNRRSGGEELPALGGGLEAAGGPGAGQRRPVGGRTSTGGSGADFAGRAAANTPPGAGDGDSGMRAPARTWDLTSDSELGGANGFGDKPDPAASAGYGIDGIGSNNLPSHAPRGAPSRFGDAPPDERDGGDGIGGLFGRGQGGGGGPDRSWDDRDDRDNRWPQQQQQQQQPRYPGTITEEEIERRRAEEIMARRGGRPPGGL
jgi:hypothetical protein